jgi:hypothetical protein
MAWPVRRSRKNWTGRRGTRHWSRKRLAARGSLSWSGGAVRRGAKAAYARYLAGLTLGTGEWSLTPNSNVRHHPGP